MFENIKRFLVEVWREVRPTKGRVTWPSAKSIRVSTVVVMVSSVALALYIFACDLVLRTMMERIISA